MSQQIQSLSLASERDVVDARQLARAIAEGLGFEHHDQIRIATAVSEIARNAFRYARGGLVAFSLDAEARLFQIEISDTGGGIPHLDRVLGGSYRSSTGMGVGITGTKRLMDSFRIESSSSGTRVEFGKSLAANQRVPSAAEVSKLSADLAKRRSHTPIEELQTQNRELLRTLDELRERKEELSRINAELQDTNRGVVALYAELDERADYLRRASELKSSFLSNMSHEFRTPLNSMLALTRMLLDRMDGDLTSEQEQQIRFIQQSARELAEMVDDLLDLAKVEAGRLEVKPRIFEVSGLFGALRGMLKPLLAESSLNLIFEPVDDLAPLFTDEQKVSQVLRNFISNAIKFTAKGEVRVSAAMQGAEVEFSVADTGIGISESDQRIIFEEFAQVDSSLQHKVKGTGLGLPLSKKFAELMGGTVEVESVVGLGSTFRLRIPAHFPNTAPHRTEGLLQVDPERNFVLIVEDNPETAFVYSRYLSNANFATHTVTSVADALSVIERHRPAAIILDILLGNDTSWEFLRALKGDPVRRLIPVLMMSVTDDRHKVYGMGADAFLAKPFAPDDMVSEIVRLSSRATRPRILLVDDHEVSRYLLREHIPEDQFEIIEARDGREGIRLAQQLQPSVIFLDFFMPDLNGAEVLRDLRSSAVTAGTPVILHSNRDLSETERKFFEDNKALIFPKQSLSLPGSGERLMELMQALRDHSAGGAGALV